MSVADMRGIVGRAIVIAVAGGVVGLASATLRAGGLDLKPRIHAEACEAPAVEPKRVAPSEAAGLCAKADVLIADARPASDFAAGHIAGAVHLPCDASGAVATSALGGDHATVLVYGLATDDAVAVARTVAQRTKAQVYALEGGFAAWEKAGLACASGPCDECAQVSK